MPEIGNPIYGCDGDGFDLDEISIEKSTSQLQIWSTPSQSIQTTQVVKGDFARTATKYFSYSEDTDSFVALETAKFALLGFYTGTGWGGGSTGASSVRVGVNATPIARDTTVNQPDVNIVLSVFLNFPIGNEEAGALKELDIVAGQHLQLFTDYQGNDGDNPDINGSVRDDPNLLEHAQIIFIRRD